MRYRSSLLPVVLAAAAAAAQGEHVPPRLLAAELGPSPYNAVSGGIAAFDVSVDASGAVTALDTVQDLAPYADLMRQALPSWRFEPARKEGRAVATHVLVLGFFRPPGLTFPAPEKPRYKNTEAPDDVPWPTSVAVPPYPPSAMGGGKVILETDVSDEGTVTNVRTLTNASPFDGAAVGAARAWTFRPASRNNQDVASRLYLVLSFAGTTP